VRKEEPVVVKAAAAGPPSVVKSPEPVREPAQLAISVGPTLAIDSDDAPALYGIDARLVRSRGLFELGGAVALAGTSTSESGYDLAFLRVVAGPRAGLVLRRGRLTADVSAGPSLLMLWTHASSSDTHTLWAFAGVAGTSAQVAITPALSVGLGVDALLPATRERIAVGGNAVAEFGLVSVEVSLGILYRM
jgi:hypothetical protein